MANLRRSGMSPMAPRLAITALGQAVGEDVTQLVVTDTDWTRFAPSFTVRRPSPLLSGIPEVRAALEPEESTGDGAGGNGSGGLAQRLAGMPDAERGRVLLDLVRGSAAAILGYESAEELPANRAFREVGFDSVTAVELRNRLRAATGLSLPAALVFDHPTPAAIARHLTAELFGETPAGGDPAGGEPDAQIRAVLAAIPVARLRQAGLLDMVLRLADGGEPAADTTPASTSDLDSLDGESLLRLVHGSTTDGPTN
jgi:acyl carrier protein